MAKAHKRAGKPSRMEFLPFNLLEKLLVYGSRTETSAPPESGVQFRITRFATEPGILLLIKVDRRDEAIMPLKQMRPDFLALHLRGDLCICTIIEMKGKDHKHAIEQIVTFHELLKREIDRCLPKRFQVHIQGILLSPYNTQTPTEIIKLAKSGLKILHFPCRHSAELYPYVCELNETSRRPESIPRRTEPPSAIETLLRRPAEESLVFESIFGANVQSGGDGLAVCYRADGVDAVLCVRDRSIALNIRTPDASIAERLRSDVEAAGLQEKIAVQMAPVNA